MIKKYSIITNLGIRGVWNRMALQMLSNEDVWAWGVHQCLDVVNGHHLTLNRTFVCLKILSDFNNKCSSLRIRNEFLASHLGLKPFHCNVFRQPENLSNYRQLSHICQDQIWSKRNDCNSNVINWTVIITQIVTSNLQNINVL